MATVSFTAINDGGDLYGFDMSQSFFPLPGDATSFTTTSTTFRVIYDPGYYDEFIGTGFHYSGGVPDDGLISQWNYYWAGTAQMKISGLNMSVSDYMAFANGGDWLGLLQQGLAGDDTITGSASADILLAYGGNDKVNAGDFYDQVWGGEGNDTLTGAGGDDDLYGEAGDDALDGGAKEDWLYGGDGNDTLKGGADNDELHGEGGDDILDGGDGYDIVEGGDGNDILTGAGGDDDLYGDGGDDTLNGDAKIDYLYGGAGNDTLNGGADNDKLYGAEGNDVLNGGAGADWMEGGDGRDTFYVDNVGDYIEDADADNIIFSTISYGMELVQGELRLIGTGAINGTGSDWEDLIVGNDAANILDGGLGEDTLAGGKGNDTYIIGSDTADIIDESISNAAGGGIDTVITYLNTSDFSGVANVDNITLATGAVYAKGNSQNNVITGNSDQNGLEGLEGNDTLIGGGGLDTLDGGTGNDTMTGGLDSDTYFVDSLGDKVIETLSAAAGGGDHDVVNSSVSFSLASLAFVEDLQLFGTGKLTGTGNALKNTIITGSADGSTLDGAAGDDNLSGSTGDDTLIGGLGNDAMIGGGGNDVYMVDSLGDTVDEEANTDSDDEVRTTFAIAAGFDGVEHYTYTGSAAWTFTGTDDANKISGGSGIDKLDGSKGDDTLLGNAGDDQLVGGEGNDWLDGGVGADKLTGGDDDDTYVVDNVKDQVLGEDTATGHDTVRSSVTWTLADGLEDLVLTGTAAINGTGNADDNAITGNDGVNTLDGGAGNDTLAGGKGNDTYVIDDEDDVIDESVSNAAGGGIDTVRSSVTFDLTSHVNIENLTLTGKDNVEGGGNALNNVIIGNDGNNELTGADGNDTLTGGIGNDTLDGGTGNDTMTGGLGSDVYIVDSLGDKVIETANTPDVQGFSDTVKSSITFSLASLGFVENLVLTGAVGTEDLNGTGNALANSLSGNAGNNVLDGGTGNDSLFGGDGNDKLIGGTGNDQMFGGKDDDTYVVDSAADQVHENSGEGSDTIISSLLPLGIVANVENYTYTGTAAWTFNGDDEDNKFVGGTGVDTLSGGDGNDWLDGGAGADTLTGGDDDDTYVVDNVKDQVLGEDAATGHDTVRAGVTWTLADGLEDLVLTGTGAINGTGNTDDNQITGNDGANVLDGKTGADTLDGGKGNDTYVVDDANDVVAESVSNAAGGGIDTVQSSVTFDLTSAFNVENLTLTGKGNLNGTGSLLNNVIIGNDGNNELSGADGNDTLTGGIGNDTLDGGTGNDTMTGGLGSDVYIVDSLGDKVVETANTPDIQGFSDTVRSSITFSLASLGFVENLMLTGAVGTEDLNGTGNALANSLSGNAGNNVLDGGAGNDSLFGGDGNDKLIGGTGNDQMFGGKDDDTYVVDSAADQIHENSGEGSDTIISSLLPLGIIANVENYTYTGTAAWGFVGDGEDNKLIGGTGADTLDGGDGNDWLDGGTGADKLTGGDDDDTYVVDNVKDQVLGEDTATGHDTVRAGITWTLAAGLEDLILTGTGAINGTGNTDDNQITGNDGANTLDGGAGNDTLAGGKGNDIYVIDHEDDVIDESLTNAAGGGIDTVRTLVDFDMADDSDGIHSNLDNAILLAGATEVSGNALNNVISGAGLIDHLTLSGAGGNDTLTGGNGNDELTGGSGIDILAGGKGDDIYHVNLVLSGATAKLEDTLTEAAGIGTGVDTIVLHGSVATAGVTTLTLAANFENLDASDTGTTKLNLTGNTADNELIGNAADNILIGGGGNDQLTGGLGNDTLTGGVGNDTFHYGAGHTGSDTITDFVKGTDVLDIHDLLADAGFAGGDAFDHYLTIGTAGKDTVLQFDADGAGIDFTMQTLITFKNVILTEADIPT